MSKTSAGILMYRKSENGLQVLLGHMGGPYWAKKDEAGWTIPKGEFQPKQEDALQAAIREFGEETGTIPEGPFIELEPIRQSNKTVYAWACEGELEVRNFRSNTFEIEWPPRSGRVQSFPEIDRVEWFDLVAARIKLIKGQRKLLEFFEDKLR